MIVLTPLGGTLSDRRDRCEMMGISLILLNSSSLAMGFVNNFASVFALRVILGLAQGLFIPVALSLIADLFPPQRLALAYAVMGIALIISGAICSMMIDYIKWWGWRNVFIGIGGTFTLVGIAVLFFVKEPKRGIFTYI